ncbi:MAG: DEAD/DEAH box helicase family protein [bacterium]
MKESLIRPIGGGFAVRGVVAGICQRCNATVPENVFDEYGFRYCRRCLAFGRVSEDSVLYRYERPLTCKRHRLAPAFPLTAEQARAAAFVVAKIRRRERGFLWAVCGAGKTEMLYEGLLYALNRGDRICLAIPRKDIVAELAVRLRPIFPDTVIKAMHQGAKDDEGAHILVATIHQLIRYHQEFDLIVIDEADAYPYRHDPYLHDLVAKAIKPDATVIAMSATLDRSEERRIARGTTDAIMIPARFHRQPLDIPVVEYIGDLRDRIGNRTDLPAAVRTWLTQPSGTRRALLFVPTIAYGLCLHALLEREGYRSGVVSSREPAAAIRIRAFREERFDLLVTTTLLERGVTFRGVDVAVLSADDDIFDRDALVQISGRVGRYADHPTGEIRLFSEVMTKAIHAAILWLGKMNKRAQARGLIDDDL